MNARRLTQIQEHAESWCRSYIFGDETNSLKRLELLNKGLFSYEEMQAQHSYDLYSINSFLVEGAQIDTPVGKVNVELFECNGYYYYVDRLV